MDCLPISSSTPFLNMDILIVFSLLFSLLHAAAQPCSITRCGENQVPIRFPFHQQHNQPESCGYPGFHLACDSPNMMIYLNLPHSGQFSVRDINYFEQQINLYDPEDCLPRRLLGFNLSGSPFVAVFHHNYTFLSCPSQVMRSRLTTIGCLSNSTHSVLATSSINLARRLASSTSCRIVATVRLPVSWPAESDEDYTAELGADIKLTWHVPRCGECEEQGGTCGLKDNSSEEIDCFRHHESRGSLQVFTIMCLSIGIPALSCAVGIALFACCNDNRRQAGQNRTEQNSPAAVSPQPMVSGTGLDECTIESYEKIVLGESRRIPGPNDATCPICLSEYLSQEAIRCIPECKHCFHAECIDEWLRMNTTCPVCRNKPLADDANLHNDPV